MSIITLHVGHSACEPIISPAIEWQGGAAINNRVQICQHSREIPTPLSIHSPTTAVHYRQLCLNKLSECTQDLFGSVAKLMTMEWPEIDISLQTVHFVPVCPSVPPTGDGWQNAKYLWQSRVKINWSWIPSCIILFLPCGQRRRGWRCRWCNNSMITCVLELQTKVKRRRRPILGLLALSHFRH